MAHLNKPVYFVKDGERRQALFTVDASELRAKGWVEEGEKAMPAPAPKPQPEIVVEAGVDAFSPEAEKIEPAEEVKPRRRARRKKAEG